MWLFRNRDFTKQMLLSVAILLLGTIIAVYVEKETALAVFLCGSFWCILHFFREWKRYRDMRSLSEQIDEILHEGKTLELEHFRDAVLGRTENTLRASDAVRMTRLIEDIRSFE